MKQIFNEGLLNGEINEETIFLIREKLFEGKNSRNLKGMSGSLRDEKFYDIGAIMRFAEKIYKESPIDKSAEDYSRTIFENCVIVRNISDYVDEEILFLLFAQGFIHYF